MTILIWIIFGLTAQVRTRILLIPDAVSGRDDGYRIGAQMGDV